MAAGLIGRAFSFWLRSVSGSGVCLRIERVKLIGAGAGAGPGAGWGGEWEGRSVFTRTGGEGVDTAGAGAGLCGALAWGWGLWHGG